MNKILPLIIGTSFQISGPTKENDFLPMFVLFRYVKLLKFDEYLV